MTAAPDITEEFNAVCCAEAMAWRKVHSIKPGELLYNIRWLERRSEANYRDLDRHMEQFARAWLKARGHRMTSINRAMGECEIV